MSDPEMNRPAMLAAEAILNRWKMAAGGTYNPCVIAQNAGACGMGCDAHMRLAIASLIEQHQAAAKTQP